MFDIAWTEMLMLAVLTVLVVGPKDLPKVMRGIGNFIRKIRGMAGDFMDGVDDLARENDLADVTKQLKNIKTGNVSGFIGDAIDADGELAEATEDIKKTVAEASKITLDQVKADKKKATNRKTKLAAKKEAKEKPAKKPSQKPVKKAPQAKAKAKATKVKTKAKPKATSTKTTKGAKAK